MLRALYAYSGSLEGWKAETATARGPAPCGKTCGAHSTAVWVFMKIPFGRWRNFEIEDVPQEYLAWLRKIDLREPLRSEVTFELNRRKRERQDMAAAINERSAGQLRNAARPENLEVRS